MLDEAGWQSCQISCSNSLDEYIIEDILNQGAQIDMFGVGERLITAKSEAVFGGVYKLTAIEDEQGNIIPKIKISENVGKITNPHFKKVYRLFGNDTGKAIADYLCVHDETVDDSRDLEIFDPQATWKRKKVYNFTAKELLVPIFQGGELVYQLPALSEIQTYCAAAGRHPLGRGQALRQPAHLLRRPVAEALGHQGPAAARGRKDQLNKKPASARQSRTDARLWREHYDHSRGDHRAEFCRRLAAGGDGAGAGAAPGGDLFQICGDGPGVCGEVSVWMPSIPIWRPLPRRIRYRRGLHRQPEPLPL